VRSVVALLGRLWPPLPVWRRLDLAVVAVAVYTALVVLVDAATGVQVPGWGGASAVLNALILGVLLSFRNREAYDRWWEARKLWGQLVNDSRNLCLKAAALPGLDPDRRAELGRLVAGFAVALKDHLRGGGAPQRVPGFEKETAAPGHVPMCLAGRLLELLHGWRAEGRLTDFDLVLLDPHARAPMDVCGACERIKSTPVPLSYRSLLRHGLVLYLLTTPWLVAYQLVWWSVPVVSLLAYFLLGIEVTAEDVEEPFGRDGDDLALAAYCETIRRSVAEALGGDRPGRD
jgi:putative membrane protein